MTMATATITYTLTDEAPALATASLLPLIRSYLKTADIEVERRDISLAARILAQFSDQLPLAQRHSDDLALLGELAKQPQANIIKLPNISASIPQLKAAISELQQQGVALPDFPDQPQSAAEEAIKQRYAKVLGSAVNPVLREGNSDRRVAAAVKAYAKANPHAMGAWSPDSKTEVASMSAGDFYGSEQSVVVATDDRLQLRFRSETGESRVMKEVVVTAGEVVDAAVMSREALCHFLQQAIAIAKERGVLFSLHLKATMMKISDPILFGHALRTFLAPVFEQHSEKLQALGVNPNNGLADLLAKLEPLPAAEREAIVGDITQLLKERPALAMVDSDKGITNFHIPSDVIIDASMPAAIRAGGKMWGPDGKLADTLAVIPDRCYSGVYQQTIDFCKQRGAFDVTTMGSVSNVGLMAQKAEEYGSHDKTFEIEADGVMEVVNSKGKVVLRHTVASGDIWRMCQTREVAIEDWVKLGVTRARLTGEPAIFWLDQQRAHDANLIQKVEHYLSLHQTNGLEIKILPPKEATQYTLERLREGKNTISVTGNVLRDYLTDLFPILELGTSAKMLSIVPLLAGGGLFETGAGGSAPKHVQQFIEQNHLRWDSLGEFLALAVALEDLAHKQHHPAAALLAKSLDEANSRILQHNRSPRREIGELDTRGSHFYLALYWAEALARQQQDSRLQAIFSPLAQALAAHEAAIVAELAAVQGQRVDLGGYYRPDSDKVASLMRPSSTWREIEQRGYLE
ncbi:NADP-dependent isocitrate dehydrogenase [Ectothiorhodospiraceae bacterium BW-2]|nr:NADP-dependent isocitrate dehydrogenase [Ectothiorhodospiraceae bacterium BW-2]